MRKRSLTLSSAARNRIVLAANTLLDLVDSVSQGASVEGSYVRRIMGNVRSLFDEIERQIEHDSRVQSKAERRDRSNESVEGSGS